MKSSVGSPKGKKMLKEPPDYYSNNNSKASFLQEQIHQHIRNNSNSSNSIRQNQNCQDYGIRDHIDQQLSLRRKHNSNSQSSLSSSQRLSSSSKRSSKNHRNNSFDGGNVKSRSCDNSPTGSNASSTTKVGVSRSKSDDLTSIHHHHNNLHYQRSSSRSHNHNETEAEPSTLATFLLLSEQRERLGQCLTCGQQLYIIKQKKKPLSGWFNFGSGGGHNSNNSTNDSSNSNTQNSNNNNNNNNNNSNIHNSHNNNSNNNNNNSNSDTTPLESLSNEEFYKNYKRVPLTIPGKVERGQCLHCGTSTNAPSSLTGTSVSTNNASHSSLHNNNNNFAMDDAEEQQVTISTYAEYTHQLQQQQQHPQQHGTVPNNANGSTAVYQGSYNPAGKRHGQGKMTWSNNGDIYIGDFVNGDRHGNGTLHFGGMNGDGEYVGEWRHNQMSGLGTRRWPNGDCYTGDYLAGQRTGTGRFYFANGDMYTGEFYEDNIHGFGRYYYANGQRFEGYFHHGKRLGKGKLQRVDGTLDVGVYRGDVRIGVGVRWSADRTETWKLENGIAKKRITVTEAVSFDYEMDAKAAEITSEMEVV